MLCVMAVQVRSLNAKLPTLYNKQLNVLNQVLSSDVGDRTIVLHMDPTVDRDSQDDIMTLKAVRETIHITATHNINESLWSREQVLELAYDPTVLHVLIYLMTGTAELLLQKLWSTWKPRNLLLFSLAPETDLGILDDEVLKNIHKFVLIACLPEKKSGEEVMCGAYTAFPFRSEKHKFLGYWESHTSTTWSSLFIDRFPNFEGYNFELASWLIEKPFLYQANPSSGSNGTGVMVEIMKALTPGLNFSYTLTTIPTELTWGVIENGTWKGILGMIHRREKNFTVQALIRTADRDEAFDASEAILEDGTVSFLMRPEPRLDQVGLHRPFGPLVWASVAVFFVVSACVFSFQVR